MEPVDLNLGALGLNMDKIGGLLPGKTQRFHGWTVENQLFLKKLGFQRTKNAVEPLMLIVNSGSENWLETARFLPQPATWSQLSLFRINHQSHWSSCIKSMFLLQNPKPWILGYLHVDPLSVAIFNHVNHVSSCFIMFHSLPEPSQKIMFLGWVEPTQKNITFQPATATDLTQARLPVCSRMDFHRWGALVWATMGTIKVMAIQRRQPTSPRIRGFAKRNHQPCGHMRPWGFLPSDYWGVSRGDHRFG